MQWCPFPWAEFRLQGVERGKIKMLGAEDCSHQWSSVEVVEKSKSTSPSRR